MNTLANLGLTVKTAEYRLCEVNGKKALFHRWYESDSILLEQTKQLPGGVVPVCVKAFYGLVEHEDGTIEKVDPEKIIFKDSRYKFQELAD